MSEFNRDTNWPKDLGISIRFIQQYDPEADKEPTEQDVESMKRFMARKKLH